MECVVVVGNKQKKRTHCSAGQETCNVETYLPTALCRDESRATWRRSALATAALPLPGEPSLPRSDQTCYFRKRACGRTFVKARFRETLCSSPPSSAGAEVACIYNVDTSNNNHNDHHHKNNNDNDNDNVMY